MVTIQQRAQRQKNLIIAFFGIVFITFLILYFGYFQKEKFPLPIPPEPSFKREIEIEWEVLENPILKELETFPEIEKLKPEEMGRENPFSPPK